MNRSTAYFSVAAFLAIGMTGCASDDLRGSSTTTPVVTPAVVQTQPQTIEGQVIRSEGDAYVIREASGRQTRVYLDRNTVRDPVGVGDAVVVRYDASSGYASSIRRTGTPLLAPAASIPIPQTIEGVVQRLEGNDYVIKDLSGREVRLNVDRSTRLDGNITAGDRIVAVTNPLVTSGPYVTNLYILGSPGVVQGEIVRIEGNSYVVRDLTGREFRLDTNAATVRNGNAAIGDRVVAYLGPSSTVHAESIARR